ncbi:MAG TPA: Crp/Fnr family transcriptional regulator [Trueperaceae bacterium]|nr:Crp/Fnr family transcriptional regulator [Trueperaceae bacterium]
MYTDAEVLARCPLLAGLPDEDVLALAAAGQRRRFAAGEHVFLAGDESRGLLVSAAGRVKIYVLSPATGREVVLTIDDQFGAVAELVALDGSAYPANGQAIDDLELVIVDQSAFEGVLHQRPAIALHLMRSIGRRLRRLVALIEQISFKEVVHRLAGYLLQESHKGLPFVLDTNADIAARLGTVPELVSRNLSRLHAGGSVTMSGRTVTGIDVLQLREMAEASGR